MLLTSCFASFFSQLEFVHDYMILILNCQSTINSRISYRYSQRDVMLKRLKIGGIHFTY